MGDSYWRRRATRLPALVCALMMGYTAPWSAAQSLDLEPQAAVNAAPPAGAGRFAPSPSGDLHVGNLRTALLAWLRENIHQHGKKFTPGELVVRVTGQPLSHEAFMRYAWAKFGDLYALA